MIPKSPIKAKYRNVKTIVDGISFHSKREAKRYLELQILQRSGAIKELELQPSFQISIGGVKRQARRIVDEEVISIGARVWLAMESEWLAEQSRMEAAADMMQERARAARARGGYAHDLLDERPTTHLFGTGGEPVPAGGTAGIENSGPEEA